MKGATAEPEVKTIRLPRRSKQMTMGSIQNFFRSFIKDHSSNKNSPTVTSLSDSYVHYHRQKWITGLSEQMGSLCSSGGFKPVPVMRYAKLEPCRHHRPRHF